MSKQPRHPHPLVRNFSLSDHVGLLRGSTQDAIRVIKQAQERLSKWAKTYDPQGKIAPIMQARLDRVRNYLIVTD